MGLFDTKSMGLHAHSLFFDEETFLEFDAGANATETDNDEELETIDADTEIEGPEEKENTSNDEPEQEELETIDDEEESAEEEQPQEEETPEEEEDSDEELETIDSDDGDIGSEENDTDDESENDDNNTGSETPENDPHQKLKELEADIFDQLSAEEKEIKKNELKKLFVSLIEKCDNIIDLLQETPKSDDTVRVIDYVNNTLTDLKIYLNDYINNMYDIKTYIQNTVNFQKFLAIFESVKAIMKEIKNICEEK